MRAVTVDENGLVRFNGGPGTSWAYFSGFGTRAQMGALLADAENGARVAAIAPGEPFVMARDFAQVMAVYSAHSGDVPGATLRDPTYWAGQLAYAGNPDERFRVARDGGRVVAYARAAELYGFNCVIEHGCLPVYARAVFEAYWGDLADISQDGVLERAVARAGLDRGEFFAKIADPVYKQKLRASTDELIARGGFGSPTMFVDRDDMYFGNDRLELVRRALERAS